MGNYSFKTVTFGGFDKQDVVRYLEQAAEKSAAAQHELETENESLRQRMEELSKQLEELQGKVEQLTAQRDKLEDELEEETRTRKGLEPLARDVARLAAETRALRPDAEAYARFRERLGSIECEARNRADDLEDAAAEQTRRTAETFQSQYQKLMSVFTAAASIVTGELQRLQKEFELLPKNMDETETELNELVDCLQKGRDSRADYLMRKLGQAVLPKEEEAEPFQNGQDEEND